jgi:multiple sugar transport system substrate-binding protein
MVFLGAACAPAAVPTAPPPQVITQIVPQTQVVQATTLVEATKIVQVEVTAVPKPVKLVVLTHWGEESLLKPMQAKIAQYMALYPNVTIELQAVTFDQLLPKITTARAAGISPDIYHFYNLWMPDFVKGGLLSVPPEDVVADINANFSPGSVKAVTFANSVWGYPTEIDLYQLVYNKKMFADAGITKPPTTFAELKDDACKLKVVGADGKISRAGMVLMPGWDSGVVHPFLSLLWSAGGKYVADDNSKSLFNGPEGLATLTLYTDMIKDKCADPSIGSYNDFVTGKGAMIIMANWFRSTLITSFADKYENVGVAPIPTNGTGTSIALQYNWLWGVDNGSKNRDEAWKFVKWLNSPESEGKASPMGDYLTSALGAIPSRLSDQTALADRMNDDFMVAFLKSGATALPEPVFAGAQEVKTAVQTSIESAWYGKASAADALKAAAAEADRILKENQ